MNKIETTSSNHGKLRQFLVAVVANLLSLSCGITCGWPSPVIPQLSSKNPPIGDGPMSEDQISWITSLLAIGGLLTIPFCGILVECIGRKKFALLTALPHIISWLLIISAKNEIYLYLARFAGGMGNAMTLFIVPLYISEIATEDIRGFLGSLLLFAVNIGILFAFVVGAYFSYHSFAGLTLLLLLGYVVIFGFMPESPISLLRQNRPLDAYKSLMFLRGNNQIHVEQELAKLRAEIQDPENSSNTMKLRDLLKDRATCRGLIISFVLLGGQQLSGIFAMITYAETIFEKAGSSLSASTASIIIAVIQLIGSYMSTMLMERAGRRLLTLISCIGMAISLSVVALFFCLLQNNYDVSSISWLPLVALSAYIITYCLGIGPVPYVVTSEIFRADVSSVATTICYIFYWTICFAALQAFDKAILFLGVAGCFFMLASFCVACFVFSYFLLPETKGRERQDIVNEFGGVVRNKHNDNDEFAAETV